MNHPYVVRVHGKEVTYVRPAGSEPRNTSSMAEAQGYSTALEAWRSADFWHQELSDRCDQPVSVDVVNRDDPESAVPYE